MTISSTVIRSDYIGTGTVGPFAYTFRIQDPEDLQVTIRDLSDIETTLSYPGDYSVSDAGSSGGSVTLTNALTSGYVISIRRNVSVLQPTQLRNQGEYFGSTHEDALDRGVMIAQQQEETLQRSVRLPVTVSADDFDPTLPAAMAAGDALVVNVAGTGFDQAALSAAQLSAWDAAHNKVLDIFTSGVEFTAGVTTALTLSADPGSEQNVLIVRRTSGANVTVMSDEFSLSGTTLTFGSAIPANTTRIEVYYSFTYQVNTADAVNLTWNGAGAGAAGRSVRDKLRDIVHIMDFLGADPTGATDSSAAIRAAETYLSGLGGGTLVYPKGDFRCDSAFIHKAYVKFQGAGKYATKIRKHFNGDLCTVESYAGADGIWFEGDAPTYTGRLLVMNDATNGQSFTNSRIYNADGYCIDFVTTTAGSQCYFGDCDIWRYNSTNNTRFSVHVQDAVQVAAYPRKFVGIETFGGVFYDAGGSNDTFINGGYIGGMQFSANSRSVHMGDLRWGNQTACTIDGANHTISGCAILPDLTIAAVADNIAIGDNSRNGTLTDNSARSANYLDIAATSYTPTLSSTGVAPTIGNGTVTAQYARSGCLITAAVEITIGSTTTLGTGDLRVSLPQAPANLVLQCGSGYARDSSSGAISVLTAVVQPTVTYALLFSNSGPVDLPLTPWVFATGDTIRFTITYMA